MYDKFKYFSINQLGGFNEGSLINFKITEEGLVFEGETNSEGIYYSLSFDSQTNGNQWHKVRAWLEVPEGMYYEISYFASDYKNYAKDMGDIDLYMLNKKEPEKLKERYLKELWHHWNKEDNRSIINGEDALFNKAEGRYLWIRIKVGVNYLRKTEKTCIINKIRIYYPRMSFLDYLPAVYQEDPESKDFLERFLSIFSTIHDEMEEKVDNISRYFDVDLVEGDYLKWLSNWIAIAEDDRWENDKLRELLKKAPEIYKVRGTRKAIEEMVSIYTGEKPMLIEFFEYKDLLKDVELKNKLLKLYGDDPYTFSVLVRSECVKENYQRMAVRKILLEEKPAYTKVRLVVLQNSIELDGHTYLGVNSKFAGASPLLLDPEKSILYNNVLVNDEGLEA